MSRNNIFLVFFLFTQTLLRQAGSQTYYGTNLPSFPCVSGSMQTISRSPMINPLFLSATPLLIGIPKTEESSEEYIEAIFKPEYETMDQTTDLLHELHQILERLLRVETAVDVKNTPKDTERDISDESKDILREVEHNDDVEKIKENAEDTLDEELPYTLL